MNFKKKFFFIYLICVIAFFYPFSQHCFADEIDYSDNFVFSSSEVAAPTTSLPQLNSRAAVILEKSTGTILFGKNENDIKKMASTTKIMTS